MLFNFLEEETSAIYFYLKSWSPSDTAIYIVLVIWQPESVKAIKQKLIH